MYISKGVTSYFKKKYCIFCLRTFLPLQTVMSQMKFSIMLHFIWDFTVCKSTPFGASQVQRVKVLICCFVWFDSLRPINSLSVKQGRVFLGWTSTKLGLMCLAQGPQRSDASEARTRGLSVSSQALFHWATVLPPQLLWVCCILCFFVLGPYFVM